MKAAFIDLDGVIADCTKRIEKALLVKEAYRQILRNDLSPFFLAPMKKLEPILEEVYWQTIFNPDLVELDEPMPGAHKALEELEEYGYTLFFLSSRPESMRTATLKWLMYHKFLAYDDADNLILIAPAFKDAWTKTVVWKIGMIQQLAGFLHIHDLILIDDKAEIREALTAEGMSYPFKFQVRAALVENLE